MGTQAWGPCMWKTLHFVALGYPESPNDQERTAYHAFFSSLHLVIPCKRCATNYLAHLRELPLDMYLDSRDRLFEWTVRVHNIVNKEHGKPEWEVGHAKQHYIGLLSGHPSSPHSPGHLDSQQQPPNDWLTPALLILAVAGAAAALLFLMKRRPSVRV